MFLLSTKSWWVSGTSQCPILTFLYEINILPKSFILCNSRSHQEIYEETFLPVLKTLLNAPTSSPLSRVDVTNVVDLLIQLTDVRNLVQFNVTTDTSQNNLLNSLVGFSSSSVQVDSILFPRVTCSVIRIGFFTLNCDVLFYTACHVFGLRIFLGDWKESFLCG